MDWDEAETITGAIEHSVAAAAFLIGGLWAYFRFDRFRTLKPRLNFRFEWARSDVDKRRSVVILTLKLENMGRTNVALRRDRDPQCFLKYALIQRSASSENLILVNVPQQRLQHLDIVFAPHRWIEPGETIDDVKLFEVDRTNLLAIQVELVVFGAKRYSAPSAFSLVDVPSTKCSASEDEQDEYEEIDLLIEALGSILTRIGRVDESVRHALADLTPRLTECLGRLKDAKQQQLSAEAAQDLVGKASALRSEGERRLRSAESGSLRSA